MSYVSLQQNWRRGQNRFCLEVGAWGAGGVREVAQTMYVHMKVNVKTVNERRKKKKRNISSSCVLNLWMGLHYQFSWLSGLQTWDGKITISFPASQTC
jgi:hypothetical protein